MDNKDLEKKAIDRLLQKGYSIKVGNKNYTFHEPYLATLDRLSELSINMELDEDKLNENPTRYLSVLKNKNSKLIAAYIATFYLRTPLKVKLFRWYFTRVFLRITPSQLRTIAFELKILENDPDFINSIRLIAQMPRQSSPKASLVEKQA